MLELKDYAENIAHCIQCGFCQSVCPVFAEEKTAMAAARGKISMVGALGDGELAVNDRFAGRLFNCLLCTNCQGACPSGVRLDEIFLAARREVVRQTGLGWVKRGALSLWADQMRLAAAVKLLAGTGAAAQTLSLARHVPWSGLFAVPRGRFSHQVSPKAVPQARMRVGYFTGCATNVVYHSVGRAVLAVLEESGVEVVVPETQQCCGLPLLTQGETDRAAELLRADLELFAGCDAVVCDCPSCSWVLREIAPVLLADGPGGALAGQVGGKVRDIMEFVAAMGGGGSHAVPVAATYHVPCHAKRRPALPAAARQLMGGIAGLQLVEMEEPEKCCGGGGSFFLTHSRTAGRIREHKLADIGRTGAGVVCTECPVCRTYLAQGLRHKGMPQQVLHPVELLARTFGGRAGSPPGT